jgi:hypothetical protein
MNGTAGAVAVLTIGSAAPVARATWSRRSTAASATDGGARMS